MKLLYRWADAIRERRRVILERAAKLAPRKHIGQLGEDIAHRYLQSQGLLVIGRNWRTRAGDAELDILAWDGPGLDGTLVFVEVKSRTSEDHSSPERQFDEAKQAHVARAASEFLRRFAPSQKKIRFDLVSVVLGDGSQPEIRHERDAFSVDWLGEDRAASSTASATSWSSGAHAEVH